MTKYTYLLDIVKTPKGRCWFAGYRRRFVRLHIREPKGEPDGLSRTIPMSEAISGRRRRKTRGEDEILGGRWLIKASSISSSSSIPSSNLKDPEGAAHLSNKSEGIRQKLGDGEARFASIANSLRSLRLKSTSTSAYLPVGRRIRRRLNLIFSPIGAKPD